MFLALDIGNTSVTRGLYQNGRWSHFGYSLFSDIPKFVKKVSRSGGKKQIKTIISSVVPKKTRFIVNLIGRNPRFEVFVAGKDLKIPLNHRYRSKKLGMDRQVNLYGAIQLYNPPLLVVDFGTAVKFDYISPEGIFEGGLIVPGPEISFQALMGRAALLPKNLRLPTSTPSFLGRNTLGCMKAGILQGYGALTDGLVARFRERYGKSLRVVATGGFARVLQPYTRSLRRVDPKLSVKSLKLLFENSLKIPS